VHLAAVGGVIAQFHDWLERWAPAADWAVAIGTALLAVATYVLARKVRTDANAVSRQVALEREHLERETLPLVYPLCTHDFAWGTPGSRYDLNRGRLLPLENGGPGVALNVHGSVWLPAPSSGARRSIDVHGGTIAAGAAFDARLGEALSSGWAGVEGFVVYDDIAGGEWATHFRFGTGPTGQIVCAHEPPSRTAETGDPRARYGDTAPSSRV
jgi:hypothetical protein